MRTPLVRRLIVVASLVLALVTAACEEPIAPAPMTGGPTAAAVHPDRYCTYADAELVFHHMLLAYKLWLDGNHSRLTDAFTRCQYRLFFNGQTFTFRQGDVFLGGINLFWDYETMKTLGITRAAAIADLEATKTRAWLARVQPDGHLGHLVEQPLKRTPYTNGMHPDLGPVVQQHRAFITSLPAGEYVSVFEMTWEASFGYPAGEERDTVRLVITP